MRFILDENFSFRIAKILRVLIEGQLPIYEIEHLDKDLNQGGVPDPEWLASLPSNEQISLLTKDHGIRKRPHERAAWRKSGVITFFFRDGWFYTKGNEQASLMIKWWPAILEIASGANNGDVFSIPYNSKPKRLGPL